MTKFWPDMTKAEKNDMFLVSYYRRQFIEKKSSIIKTNIFLGGKNMKYKKFKTTFGIAAMSLSVLCMSAAFGTTVRAEEHKQPDAVYQEADDWTEDSLEWNLDADGTLTITGTGDIDVYYWNEFDQKNFDVKKIVANVTGSRYFILKGEEFPNLESVDLRGFDASQITDLSYAFSRLTKLKNIEFGNFNTQNVTDMHDMFYDCSSLTSLNLSGFQTGKVTDMSGMFYGCGKLSDLNISGLNTGSVTDMESMFYGCNSLTNLNLGSFRTDSVTDMRYMFSGCIELTGLDLSSFSTANVTNMSSMFEECRSLKSLNLSGFQTGKVLSMYSMFWGCSSLSALDLSGFQTGNVREIDNMFYDCNQLKELDLSNFNLENVELTAENTGETFPIHLFGNVDNLVKIKMPANLPERVIFPYSNLMPNNMVAVWTDESGAECEYVKKGLSVPMTYTCTWREYSPSIQPPAYVPPAPLPSGTNITDAATFGKYVVSGADTVTFAGTDLANAKTVTIPDSVTYLGITYKVTAVNAKALRGKKNITGVTIGANVAKLGDGAFENCTKLKKVTIGSGVTSIGKNAFKGCKNLKKIQVKSTKVKSVGKNAFKNIHKKCKIKVPASKVRAYQKKMKSRGQAKSVKIVK